MAKILLILVIGLIFESAGIVLLKKSINQVSEIKTSEAATIAPSPSCRGVVLGFIGSLVVKPCQPA